MNARLSTLPARAEKAGPQTLDWDLAVATASRLLPPGPEIPKVDADRAVRALREYSVHAESHVREITGLGERLPIFEGDVVDRPGWVRASATGLAALTDTAMADASSPSESTGSDLLSALGSRGAGVQGGVVLAYLGSKVLGQYDPFAPAEDPGRLLLVAPNIVAAERALGVPADDFRMWVCLHESTHRLQFNAVPWLREHFVSSLGALLSAVDGSSTDLIGRLPSVLREARTRRAGDASPGMLGVVELLQGPQQRAALDRVLALSTLLEGHADHVMDAVGPRVVPSVGTIRQRFTERRKGGGLLDRLLRSLLGVDAKMKQYAQGAEFTRHVVGAVGMSGFNAVWTSPEHLPSRAEIAAPAAWLRRIHG